MKKISLKKSTYLWTGLTPQGKKMSGEIQALSVNLAKIALRHQGIISITLTHKRKKLFSSFSKAIGAPDIAILFRQLATLLKAGIPLVQSLEIIRQSLEKPVLKNVIQTLKSEIEAGKTLVLSLQQFPQHFDTLTCHLINAGELSGKLDTLLHRIAYYKEKSLALQRQTKKALFYPTLIFIVAIIISLIMLTIVIPRFAELFQTMHGQLPAFTASVIHFAEFLRNHASILFLFMLSCGLSLFYLKRAPLFKQKMDYFILKPPILGNIVKKIILARLLRSFAITFAAGIPINEAL